jgi:pimeloyl-ACP methyl ester carboxylesterase
MALSVLCSEGAASKFLTRACAIWPHTPYTARPAVRGETPTLLISGALDPLTPPPYAAEVAKGLTNNAQVVFANASHVPANPCIHGIITSFLKTASPKGLATGCVAAFPPLKFVTVMPKLQ